MFDLSTLNPISPFLLPSCRPLTDANTHTESSVTGLQTTAFREEARSIVLESVKADEEEYCCIFVGTGCTGAVSKLIDCLGIKLPSNLQDTFDLKRHIPASERPIVFVGPYEHHSNEVLARLLSTLYLPSCLDFQLFCLCAFRPP